MNWGWTEKEGTGKSRQRVEYECRTCKRGVYTYPDGYLPIHRHKGKRDQCKSSKDPASWHTRK